MNKKSFSALLLISMVFCYSIASAEQPQALSNTPAQASQQPAKREAIIDLDEQFPDEKGEQQKPQPKTEALPQATPQPLPAKEHIKKQPAELTPDDAEAARKSLERMYQIPEEFIDPPIKQEPVAKPQAPPPSKSVQTTTPKPSQPAVPAKPKSFFDKSLEFIFGADQSPQGVPRRPINIAAEEFEKNEINFKAIEELKESIKGIESIQGLKPIEQIVRNAIKSSPEVAKTRMELQIVKQQNTFMPTPTFYVGNNPATAKSNMGVALNLSLEPLFTGKSRQRHAELTVIQTEIMVTQRVIEQYRLILNLSKKLANRQGKTRYINQLTSNVREQYKGGLIKIDELIKGEELKWSVELEEETLKLDLQTAIERLNALEFGGK